MTELLTSAQMRALEEQAIASGLVTGLELMERAGQGVVEAVYAHWPQKASGTYTWQEATGPKTRPLKAVILCGPGNNGGDGYVVARLLQGDGWDVVVYGLGRLERMPPDARQNRARWQDLGPTHLNTDPALRRDWAEEAASEHADLFVDALFGIGLTRPLDGALAYLAGYMAEKKQGRYRDGVVAIDIPSGLDADRGAVLGGTAEQLDDYAATGRSFQGFQAIPADLTVTFHRAKHGHVLGHGPLMCGTLVVADIGL